MNYRYVSSINISTERILQAKAQLSCGSDAQEHRPRLSKATVATKGLALKQVANWRNKCIKPILSYPYDIHILYTYILLFLLDEEQKKNWPPKKKGEAFAFKKTQVLA